MFVDSPGGEQRVRLERRALLALALAYPWVLAASMTLGPSVGVHAAFWPPYALSYAAYRLLPAAHWPWVVLGVLIADLGVVSVYDRLFHPVPGRLLVLAQMSLANSLMCFGMAATVAAVRRMRGLQRFGAVMRFLWLVLLGVGAAPGIALMIWLRARNGYPPLDGLDLLSYLLTCVLSVQIGGPVLFGILRRDRELAKPPAHRWEAIGVAALFAALAVFLLMFRWPLRDRFTEIILLAVPLIWVALRFSRRTVATAVASMSALLAFAAAHGAGEFGALAHTSGWSDAIVSTQIFLMVACGEALLINRTLLDRQRLIEQHAAKQAQLHAYAEALDRAEDTARRGAAGELHEGVGQILAGQAMILSAMRQHSAAQGPFHSMLNQALAASQDALTAVQHTIHDLSPPQLSDASLREVLQMLETLFETRYAFRIGWQVTGDEGGRTLPVRLVYRTVRELVYNAYKHSRTEHVDVALQVSADFIEIRVNDAGIGFDTDLTPGRARHGLVNVTGRIRAAGGRVIIDSGRGNGCRITVLLPLPSDGAVDSAQPPAQADAGFYAGSRNNGRLASRSSEGADKPKWA